MIFCPASAIEAERVRLIIFALDSAYNAGELVPSYLYRLYLSFPFLVPFGFRDWMLEKRSPDNPLFGRDTFSFPYLPSVFLIVDHLTIRFRCSKSFLMDVGDSRIASCDAVRVLRGVAVHGIHEVWLSRASKFCPSVVLVLASE